MNDHWDMLLKNTLPQCYWELQWDLYQANTRNFQRKQKEDLSLYCGLQQLWNRQWKVIGKYFNKKNKHFPRHVQHIWDKDYSIFNSMKIQEIIITYCWKVETQTTFRQEDKEKKKGYKSRLVLPPFWARSKERKMGLT